MTASNKKGSYNGVTPFFILCVGVAVQSIGKYLRTGKGCSQVGEKDLNLKTLLSFCFILIIIDILLIIYKVKYSDYNIQETL